MKGSSHSKSLEYSWIIRWAIELLFGAFLIYLVTVCFFPEFAGGFRHLYWVSIGSKHGMLAPLYSSTVLTTSAIAYTIICLAIIVIVDKITDYGADKIFG